MPRPQKPEESYGVDPRAKEARAKRELNKDDERRPANRAAFGDCGIRGIVCYAPWASTATGCHSFHVARRDS